ncbi:hypothetical protein D9619_003675 [Psilocybe cf. subviscida]|uniref:PSP1 C-terminal domain-containing protein n=1 Tax=Psilocybe cf. subviscida TaxID=2480587 RepID=A0A8H5AXB5_9AGAR|nr:hypothetical protein D9619_003675 [Psilocybe cf. subviscida]
MEQNAAHDSEDDRRSRFQGGENGIASLRERAASQPPRTSDGSAPFLSSPPGQNFIPASLSGNPWPNSRMLSSNRQAVPIRSSSFSSQPANAFTSSFRDRTFPSTFEDDESEALSDTFDERYDPPSLSRGRTYAQDVSRSRSQSLAAGRPGPVGSPYTPSAMQSWNESYLSSQTSPLNIQRYGEMKPPGQSRYGTTQPPDVSNMSPFVRDVNHIVLDDNSALKDLWVGRDEGGGGSGTTSRRHSVSIVQPRRSNVVGFNAPAMDNNLDDVPRSSFQSYSGRGGSLALTDDDLAVDIGLLNIGSNSYSSSNNPPSQPSSLPIYAPMSRSPVSRNIASNYQSINLTIPSNSYSRQTIGTPSDNGDFSASNSSPPRSAFNYEQHLAENQYNALNRSQQQQQQQDSTATARFIPGQGIQYVNNQQFQQGQNQQQFPHSGMQGSSGNTSPYVRNRAPSYSSQGNMQSPISPSGTRIINPQQPPYYPQTQRRLSDAQHHMPPTPTSAQLGPGASTNYADLGKGVPLHAVPPSWPLFIVEFKAGRTDLFYLMDMSQDVRVGDLVIVEADRGKDLGKVVNDSITVEEVEQFQREQAERGWSSAGGAGGGGDGQPTSPGGGQGSGAPPGGKKDINPKMIYRKAGGQDMQLLATKTEDEVKALQLCQTKVRAKKLPMEVIDAEYQWDRRKLTFYFIAEKRIDFRELVRELFRLYKTRIWMASLQGGGGFEQ